MKVHILAIAAHPDDVELNCAGTILRHLDLGYSAGIIDLTQGELGTRGTGPIRLDEASKAADLLGVSFRLNLGMADGFFKNTKENQIQVVQKIREFKPDIVLTNALSDRHPDHGRAARLVTDACFISGLVKVETVDENGNPQIRWSPNSLYYFVQDYLHIPNLIVDVSKYMDMRMKALKAFTSQFYNPDSKEPDSSISSHDYLEQILGRARTFGRQIGVEFGEGYTAPRAIGTRDMIPLI